MSVPSLRILAIGLVCACHPAPPVDQPNDPEAPVDPAPMAEHFLKVIDIKDAVIAGDLERTRVPAQWLIDNVVTEDLPVRWHAHVPEVHRAAKAVIAAETLEAAGSATADLGAACGGCHAGMGLDLTPTEAPDPLQDDTKFAQMMRHSWAADRLWDGLVGPSDAAWVSGTKVLREAPLHGDAAPEQVAGLAQRVYAISHQAAAATALPERASVYAELISTCAACHVAMKPEPTAAAVP
jgi:cytochrome c553